jgi:cell division protein FtsB
MRFLRYLFAFWTAFAVYSLFTFAYGPGSLQVQKQLEEEVVRLTENLDELKLTNRKFLNTAASLETDRETLSVYARQLGYGHPGEKFIRIIGQESTINPEIYPGRVLQAAEPEYVPDVKTKVLALAFALAVLIFFIAVDFLSLKGRNESP